MLARERRIVDPLALADRIRESHGEDYGWEDPQGFINKQIEKFTRAWEIYTRPLWTKSANSPGPLGGERRSLSSSNTNSR